MTIKQTQSESAVNAGLKAYQDFSKAFLAKNYPKVTSIMSLKGEERIKATAELKKAWAAQKSKSSKGVSESQDIRRRDRREGIHMTRAEQAEAFAHHAKLYKTHKDAAEALRKEGKNVAANLHTGDALHHHALAKIHRDALNPIKAEHQKSKYSISAAQKEYESGSYKKFFIGMMKKFGLKRLKGMSRAEFAEFFNAVKEGWKSKSSSLSSTSRARPLTDKEAYAHHKKLAAKHTRAHKVSLIKGSDDADFHADAAAFHKGAAAHYAKMQKAGKAAKKETKRTVSKSSFETVLNDAMVKVGLTKETLDQLDSTSKKTFLQAVGKEYNAKA